MGSLERYIIPHPWIAVAEGTITNFTRQKRQMMLEFKVTTQ